MKDGQESNWTDAISLSELEHHGRKVVKLDGKQIVLFRTRDGVKACNNRCPHEGYPLVEGNLGGGNGCTLTCNWHNWKFDLESGDTLVGGDRLRRYPARVEGDRVFVDIADPPAAETIAAALDNLTDSFDRHEYDRMAREVARLIKAGGDPLDALRRTLAVTAPKFEYGTTHAVPATADWLALRDRLEGDEAAQLTCLVETVGHFAWDTRREPDYPMAEAGAVKFDGDALVAAIEAEDEPRAQALAAAGLVEGLGYDGLRPYFARAALAHYADFGHSAIYTYKTGDLAARLQDDASIAALVRLLVRSLVYQTREDLIPEFKAYGPAIAAWDEKGTDPPSVEALGKGSVAGTLKLIVAASGCDPIVLYDRLMAAGAWQMLHFDQTWQHQTDGSVSQNVNWLDFTHMLTFGNAVRKLCAETPSLWPAALLQLGCFLGRNSSYVDAELDVSAWDLADPAGFYRTSLFGLTDHGQFEFIVACHLLKLTTALEEECVDRPDVDWHGLAAAALNRFLNSPLKRKHALRTAKQALGFVRAEG